MDCMESTAIGNTSIDITDADNASAVYTASYLESFLPAYQMVNHSTLPSVADRYKAIRLAADASLALTAGGAKWSDALGKQLMGDCERTVSSDHLPFDDRLATSLGSGVTPMSAIPTSKRCSALNEKDSDCESSGLSESDRLRLNFNGASSLSRVNEISVPLVGTERNRISRASRNMFTRNNIRLAILRMLSKKGRSRRRPVRCAWKPRSTVRKAKSLALRRRTSSLSTRFVDHSAPEPRLDTSIIALQRLIPGGASMNEAVLLDEAADFVTFLKLQVQALQTVADAVDRLN